MNINRSFTGTKISSNPLPSLPKITQENPEPILLIIEETPDNITKRPRKARWILGGFLGLLGAAGGSLAIYLSSRGKIPSGTGNNIIETTCSVPGIQDYLSPKCLLDKSDPLTETLIDRYDYKTLESLIPDRGVCPVKKTDISSIQTSTPLPVKNVFPQEDEITVEDAPFDEITRLKPIKLSESTKKEPILFLSDKPYEPSCDEILESFTKKGHKDLMSLCFPNQKPAVQDISQCPTSPASPQAKPDIQTPPKIPSEITSSEEFYNKEFLDKVCVPKFKDLHIRTQSEQDKLQCPAPLECFSKPIIEEYFSKPVQPTCSINEKTHESSWRNPWTSFKNWWHSEKPQTSSTPPENDTTKDNTEPPSQDKNNKNWGLKFSLGLLPTLGLGSLFLLSPCPRRGGSYSEFILEKEVNEENTPIVSTSPPIPMTPSPVPQEEAPSEEEVLQMMIKAQKERDQQRKPSSPPKKKPDPSLTNTTRAIKQKNRKEMSKKKLEEEKRIKIEQLKQEREKEQVRRAQVAKESEEERIKKEARLSQEAKKIREREKKEQARRERFERIRQENQEILKRHGILQELPSYEEVKKRNQTRQNPEQVSQENQRVLDSRLRQFHSEERVLAQETEAKKSLLKISEITPYPLSTGSEATASSALALPAGNFSQSIVLLSSQPSSELVHHSSPNSQDIHQALITLNIDPKTWKEIRSVQEQERIVNKAFYRMSLKNHTDKHPELPTINQQLLQKARGIVSNYLANLQPLSKQKSPLLLTDIPADNQQDFPTTTPANPPLGLRQQYVQSVPRLLPGESKKEEENKGAAVSPTPIDPSFSLKSGSSSSSSPPSPKPQNHSPLVPPPSLPPGSGVSASSSSSSSSSTSGKRPLPPPPPSFSTPTPPPPIHKFTTEEILDKYTLEEFMEEKKKKLAVKENYERSMINPEVEKRITKNDYKKAIRETDKVLKQIEAAIKRKQERLVFMNINPQFIKYKESITKVIAIIDKILDEKESRESISKELRECDNRTSFILNNISNIDELERLLATKTISPQGYYSEPKNTLRRRELMQKS